MKLRYLFTILFVLIRLAALGAQEAPTDHKRENVSLSTPLDEKFFRSLEEERLHGLVEADAASFDKFHAKEYELISPVGMLFSFDSYRKAVTSGQLDYISWEIGPGFRARIYGEVAVIRYPAKLEFAWNGKKQNPVKLWHTDVYEKRSDRWMVVWSQATQIF